MSDVFPNDSSPAVTAARRDDSPSAYRMTWNTESKKLTLSKIIGPTSSATLVYDLPESDKLELRGTMDGKAVVATLQRAQQKQYPLTRLSLGARVALQPRLPPSGGLLSRSPSPIEVTRLSASPGFSKNGGD
jgi:hypothetical protein